MEKVFFFVFAILLLIGCNAEPKTTTAVESSTSANQPSTMTASAEMGDLKSEIEALKAFFASQTGKQLNKEKANAMVEKCQQFAKAFPADQDGGAYLFTGGEVARSVGRYEDAIAMFSEVEANYPNHERAPTALMMKAFTYEENLGNTELAKKYYQEFLTKYPDHELTAQVKQLLAVVGTSPEDLIKRFKEQNK